MLLLEFHSLYEFLKVCVCIKLIFLINKKTSWLFTISDIMNIYKIWNVQKVILDHVSFHITKC